MNEEHLNDENLNPELNDSELNEENGNEQEEHPILEEQPPIPKKKRKFIKFKLLFWSLFCLGVLGVGFLIGSIANSWMGFSILPSFEQLENPDNNLASEVYSADGVLLGKFFIENRSNVRYEEIPDHFINALISTEDVRYWRHSGIDFYGLTTAIYRTIILGRQSGASTITQQLAKNLFHRRSMKIYERIPQKLKEWIIAVKLERGYTKKEILSMYLNTVEFSNNAHGIKAAAKTYFNKEPYLLNIQESAVLVGMLKASTTYNPIRNPNNSKSRRNIVIAQMSKYGHVTSAEKDSLQATELVVDPIKSSHDEGLATYFREFVKAELKKWKQEQFELNGAEYDIFTDGLKIYTTLDSRLQEIAEGVIPDHMKDLQNSFYKHWSNKKPWDEYPEVIENAINRSERYRVLKKVKNLSDEEIEKEFNTPREMTVFSWEGDIDTLMTPIDSIKHLKMLLQTGMIAMDPFSGDIKVWIGGINFKHFKYDNVRPSSKRQVGSTFKPFLYSMAIQNGWSPCQKIPVVPVRFEVGEFGLIEPWEPHNATDKYEGQSINLKRGLANSINVISARLMKEIGPKPVVELAKRMGIKSHMDPYPSICLGTPDISVYEMVGAYCTFVNEGVYTEPRFITRIEDKNGNKISEFVAKRHEVLSPEDAYIMVNLMSGVTQYGTGQRLRWKYDLRGEIAGKTGTTDDQSDGWFMGITPELVAGVWTGGDEKRIRFRDLKLGSGSNTALPVWGEFFKRIYEQPELGYKDGLHFKRPKGELSIELDCGKYAETTIQSNTKLPSPDYYETKTEEDEIF